MGYGMGVIVLVLCYIFVVFDSINSYQHTAEYLINKHISTSQVISGDICNEKIETNYDFTPIKTQLEYSKNNFFYYFFSSYLFSHSSFIYFVKKYDIINQTCFSNRLKINGKKIGYSCNLDLNSYLNFLGGNHSWETIKQKNDNWFIKLIDCSYTTKTIQSVMYDNKNLNNFIKICDIKKIDNIKKYINCKKININLDNIFVLSKNKIAIKLDTEKKLYIINNINDMKEFIINKKYKNITSYSLYKYEYKYFYNTSSNKGLLIIINFKDGHTDIYYGDKILKFAIGSGIKEINYSYSIYDNNIYVLLKIKFETSLQKYILLKSSKGDNFKIVFNKVKDKNIKDVVLSGNKLIIKKKLFHLIRVFK